MNPPANRARFLSNKLHADYVKDYAQVGAVLAAEGVPDRIDEMNSCYNGGAKDSSDTSTRPPCGRWIAPIGGRHNIFWASTITPENRLVGMASLARQITPPFCVNRTTVALSCGLKAMPYLAFSQSAHGCPLAVKLQAALAFDFDAYAYQARDGSFYLTLINKSYGDHAQPAAVTLQLPSSTGSGAWQRMDLMQQDSDVAANSGVWLGGAAIDSQGIWRGQWKQIEGENSAALTVLVAPAFATILHFSRNFSVGHVP